MPKSGGNEPTEPFWKANVTGRVGKQGANADTGCGEMGGPGHRGPSGLDKGLTFTPSMWNSHQKESQSVPLFFFPY